MIWKPRHPTDRPCAWCHKPLTEKHPPYLITKDQKIFGPYHIGCVDDATRQLDPEAMQRRNRPRYRVELHEEQEK